MSTFSSRRDFLARAGLLGAAVAVTTVLPDAALAGPVRSQGVSDATGNDGLLAATDNVPFTVPGGAGYAIVCLTHSAKTVGLAPLPEGWALLSGPVRSQGGTGSGGQTSWLLWRYLPNGGSRAVTFTATSPGRFLGTLSHVTGLATGLLPHAHTAEQYSATQLTSIATPSLPGVRAQATVLSFWNAQRQSVGDVTIGVPSGVTAQAAADTDFGTAPELSLAAGSSTLPAAGRAFARTASVSPGANRHISFTAAVGGGTPPTLGEFAQWGDSLSAIGEANPPAHVPDTSIAGVVNHILGLGFDRLVYGGIGGQASAQIAARQGGRPATTDGRFTIPDSGAQTFRLVRGASVADGDYRPLRNTRLPFFLEGYFELADGRRSPLGNVSKVTDQPGDTLYRFERLSAGPGGFTVDAGSTLRCTIGDKHRDGLSIIECGGNDITQWEVESDGSQFAEIQDRITFNINKMVAFLTTSRFLVLGLTTGPNSGRTGTDGGVRYNRVGLVNAKLEVDHQERYLDWRRELVDRGYELAGVTPTPDDLDKRADDTIGWSLINIDPKEGHLNEAGRRAAARIIVEKLVAVPALLP